MMGFNVTARDNRVLRGQLGHRERSFAHSALLGYAALTPLTHSLPSLPRVVEIRECARAVNTVHVNESDCRLR